MIDAVGVEATRAGWLAIHLHEEENQFSCRAALLPAFAEMVARAPQDSVTAIGVPIGLPGQPGARRRCDELAREALGPKRATVLYAPARVLLAARDYRELKGQGISQPAFRMTPMLAEVDAVLNPQVQKRVVEGHAEWAYHVLNGGPLKHRRQLAAGREERLLLLRAIDGDPFQGTAKWLNAKPFPYRELADPSDLVDACAQTWVAWHVAKGIAVRVPDKPDPDLRGLDQVIWGLPDSACVN